MALDRRVRLLAMSSPRLRCLCVATSLLDAGSSLQVGGGGLPAYTPGAVAPSTLRRANSRISHRIPIQARNPGSLLLMGFLLGTGTIGSAVYTSSLLHPGADKHGSRGERGSFAWEETLQRILGGLWGSAAAAVAAAASSLGRSPSSRLEAADPSAPARPAPSAALGPHFIADAAARAAPAVVNVTVNHAHHRQGFGVFATKSSGSGFIIDPSGVILTNAHVVVDATGRQAAQGITVTLQDGRIFEGGVASFDRVSDLAVIRVKSSEPLPTVKMGSSAGLRVGEWVVSLGSPLHLQNSVTCGIISCVDRKAVDLGLAGACPEYIQTDAPINQGSSGGPLINLDGEVIGVTSMKAVAADGVSFAIPIDTAKNVIKQLSDQGRVIRPYIGIKMLELNPMIASQLRQRDSYFPNVQEGILVVQVTPGSPADIAGLQAGDVIVDFHGRSTGRPGQSSMSSDLINTLGKSVGKPLLLQVLRTGQPRGTETLRVTVTASEAVWRD